MKRGFGFWAFVGIALVALAATASATIIGTSGQMTKIAHRRRFVRRAGDRHDDVCIRRAAERDARTTAQRRHHDAGHVRRQCRPDAGDDSRRHGREQPLRHADHVGHGGSPGHARWHGHDRQGHPRHRDPCQGLNDSDYLGAPGTLYPTGEFGRGFNLDNQDDFVIEQIDKRTVQIHSDVRITPIRCGSSLKRISRAAAGARHDTGLLGTRTGRRCWWRTDAFSAAKAVELGIPGLCYVKVDSQTKSKQILPSTKTERATGCSGPSTTASTERVQQRALADPRLEPQHPLPGRLCGQTLGALGCSGVGPLTSGSTVEQAAATRTPDRQRQDERRRRHHPVADRRHEQGCRATPQHGGLERTADKPR